MIRCISPIPRSFLPSPFALLFVPERLGGFPFVLRLARSKPHFNDKAQNSNDKAQKEAEGEAKILKEEGPYLKQLRL